MTGTIRTFFRALADIPRFLRLTAFWLVGAVLVAVGTVHDIVTRPPSPDMFAGQVAIGAWRRGWGWDGSWLPAVKFPLYFGVDVLAADAAPSTRFVLAAVAVGLVTWALPTLCLAWWMKSKRLAPPAGRLAYAGLLVLAAVYGLVFRGARPDGANIEVALGAIVVGGFILAVNRFRTGRGRVAATHRPPELRSGRVVGTCALYVAPLVVVLAVVAALGLTAHDSRTVQTGGWPLADPIVSAALAAADAAADFGPDTGGVAAGFQAPAADPPTKTNQAPAIAGTASTRYTGPVTFLSGFAADAVPHLCVTAPDRLDLAISPAPAARLAARTAPADDGGQAGYAIGNSAGNAIDAHPDNATSNQTVPTFIIIDEADQLAGCDEEIVTLQFGDDYAARYQLSKTTWMFIYTRDVFPEMQTVS